MYSRISTALIFTCVFVVHFLSEQHLLCAKGLTRIAQSELSHANFLKDLFHYLNVSQVGSALVVNVQQCGLVCIKVVTCFSFNVAAYHDIDGRLYCELLASDKYNSSDKFQENLYYHHYSIYTPCFKSPCRNGGKCIAFYEQDDFMCACPLGFEGKKCEKASPSRKQCKQLYTDGHREDKAYELDLDSGKVPVYCHMSDIEGCGSGGFSLVMKMNGSQETFLFDSTLWTNKSVHNPNAGATGFDNQETKLPTYWQTPFTKVCLGMKVGEETKFISINKEAASLHSLIADGQHRATSLGRDAWKSLISGSSLQPNCNREGFNAMAANGRAKARIGITSNNENTCDTNDSRIGFGTGGHPDNAASCGDVATKSGDNGKKRIEAFGYILVQ